MLKILIVLSGIKDLADALTGLVEAVVHILILTTIKHVPIFEAFTALNL